MVTCDNCDKAPKTGVVLTKMVKPRAKIPVKHVCPSCLSAVRAAGYRKEAKKEPKKDEAQAS